MKLKCRLNIDSDIYFYKSTPVYFDEDNNTDIWFNIEIYKRKDKFYGKLETEDVSLLYLIANIKCVYLKPIYEVNALLGFILDFTNCPTTDQKIYSLKKEASKNLDKI